MARLTPFDKVPSLGFLPKADIELGQYWTRQVIQYIYICVIIRSLKTSQVQRSQIGKSALFPVYTVVIIAV
jgi:hypothetical protein